MSTVIGQLTLPDAQAAALKPIAELVEAELGTRINPVSILVKPRNQMPEYAPGKHARGFWRERGRRILLADDLFTGTAYEQNHRIRPPLAETLGHECIHVLFSDADLSRPKLLSVITPIPEGFNDLSINGGYVGYAASPEECCCVWGSAAIFGFDPPAYVGLYKRSIPKAALPELRQILLGESAPPPTPADPCADLQAQVDALKEEIARTEIERDEARTNLADADARLERAHQLFVEGAAL